MQQDASVYYGFFTFYLGAGFAVDEQLYRHVIEESATESTAMITRRLTRMCYDHYYEEMQLYLSAVGEEKIRPRKKARTIDTMCERVSDSQSQILARRKNTKSSLVNSLRMDLVQAKRREADDIEFRKILATKKDHNRSEKKTNLFRGIGPLKIERMCLEC